MAAERSTIARGALAGIAAATAVALWFLLIDALKGHPLYTPAFLARALTGGQTVIASGSGADFGTIAIYTVVHYAVFMLAGVVVASVLRAANVRPGVLVGCVVGFLLFDLVFYASVTITGQNVIRVLGWPQVLIGNLLAGIVLVLLLQGEGESVRSEWRGFMDRHRTVREGIVAGVLGAVVVAIWFFIFDAANGHTLFTPAALGSALLRGAGSTSQVAYSGGIIAGYTVVHFAIFILVAMLAAALLNEAEHEPRILLGFVLLFVTMEVLFLGVIAILGLWILETVAWWSIGIGNLLAAIAMGLYFWRKHPALLPTYRREVQT